MLTFAPFAVMTCACKCHIKEETSGGSHGASIQPLLQPAQHPVKNDSSLGPQGTVPQPLIPYMSHLATTGVGTVQLPIIISNTPPLPLNISVTVPSGSKPVTLQLPTGLLNAASLGQLNVAASIKPGIQLPLMLLPGLSNSVLPVGGGVLVGPGNKADTSTKGSAEEVGAGTSKGPDDLKGENVSIGLSAKVKEEGSGGGSADIEPHSGPEAPLVPKEEGKELAKDDDDFKLSKKRFRQPTKKGPVSLSCSSSLTHSLLISP